MDAKEFAAAAAIAADPDAQTRARVDALVRVVDAVSIFGFAIPAAIADAVDDLAVVDAAVALGKGTAICTALHQLGDRANLATTRRRVVRRLVVAGVTGTAIAGLAVEIGDVAAGVSLAVRDHDQHIAWRVKRATPNLLVDAWLTWLSGMPDIAVAKVLRELATQGPLDALFAHGTNAAAIARLRGLSR